MPKASGKEKAPQPPSESHALDLTESLEMAKGPVPPENVLKIFRINIITSGIHFYRRQVSVDLGLHVDVLVWHFAVVG